MGLKLVAPNDVHYIEKGDRTRTIVDLHRYAGAASDTNG
ncbi:MAG: hypothetical protein CM1200mP34_4610 [Verrucomicrobiales bacterium]|nr:MAG: hypothetical protein CM1200mP34_4610 [Verrucomicrobiales bacterium]